MLRVILRVMNPGRYYSAPVRDILLLTSLLCSLLASSLSQAAEHYTTGMALWSDYPEFVRGFKEGLADTGLVEGKNLTFIEGEGAADKAIASGSIAVFSQWNPSEAAEYHALSGSSEFYSTGRLNKEA